MAIKKIIFKDFFSGLSDNESGPADSFSIGRQIDSRSIPGSLVPYRKLIKESGSTVITEIHDMVRVSNTEIYMAGGSEIYLRTSGANGAAGSYAVHTSDSNVVGVRDLDYNVDLDKLFAYDNTSIHELYNVSGSEAWDYNKYTNYLVLNQNDGTTANAYQLPTSITETAADRITFTCTAEPLYSVTFHVRTKGASGNWVVTIHDGAHRTVATATVLFASVPAAGSDIEFVFSSPVRLKIGAEYHIHLHATAGTHEVDVVTAADMSTADASTKASRLINTGEFGHFTMQYGPKTLFCNEHYLGEWEIIDTSANATAGFNPHRLNLPVENVGVGMAVYNQYVAIACGQKRGSDSSFDKITNGIIFFWDGASPSYEFALEVPQGVPFGLFALNNVLYWVAEGQLYRWAGGDIETVFEFPGQQYFFTSDIVAQPPNVELYRRAARRSIASDGGLLKIAWPHTVSNSLVQPGVFSWGRKKRFAKEVPNYDHLLSTLATSISYDTSTNPDTPVTGITCIKRFGTNLLVAWKDMVGGVVTYGVDYVNDKNGPALGSEVNLNATVSTPYTQWFSPKIDDDRPAYKKTALRVTINGQADTAPGSDVAIVPYIMYDDDGSFDFLTATAEDYMQDATDKRKEIDLPQHKRFKSCRIGFGMASSYTGANLRLFPRVDSITLEYDDNATEDDTSVEDA